MRKLQIEYIDISKLHEWDKNPKKHNKEALQKSVKEFNITQPIIVQRGTNRIIAGHGRKEAFEALGIKEIPIIYLDMNDAQAKAYALIDNQTVIDGGWDERMLKIVIEELKVELPELSLREFGFENEFKRLFPVEIIEDEPPEVPAEPKSKLGDLYQLGNHRLLCGDATKKEDVERLMDGKKADLCFTDPPYGVDIAEKNRFLNTFQKAGRCLTDIVNDTISKDELFNILNKAFLNIYETGNDHCSVYVTAPQGGELGLMMMMMMMMSNLPVRHVLIWKKNAPNFSMGRLDYEYQHEPILYTWKKTHKFYGDSECSVWEIDKPRHANLHPTMKPVELCARAIRNSSQEGEIVIDFFGGSGSTLIACEQLNRICYMAEIDPRYVDVIVQRWESLTRKKAVKLD